MAGVECLPIEDKRNLGFLTVLSSAACEWVLIFLLLLDTAFSYLLTMFAEFCKLQLPCLLCSRHSKSKPYYTILCKNHRLQISSLVSCHTHEKLADVRGLCEDCLLSYAAQNKTNSESYRLLIGRLGLDLGGYCGFHSQLLEKDEQIQNAILHCSCCGKAWNAQRLFQINKPPGNRLNRRNGLKKKRKIMLRSRTYNCGIGKNKIDPLSHVGYSELNVAPEEFSSEHGSETPRSLLLDLKSPPEVSQSTRPSPSDVSGWHGLRELNWLHVYQKPTLSDMPELISLDAPLEPCIDHASSDSNASASKFDQTVTETPRSLSLPNHMDSSDHGTVLRASDSDASALNFNPTVTITPQSGSLPNHIDSSDHGNVSRPSSAGSSPLKCDLIVTRTASLPIHMDSSDVFKPLPEACTDHGNVSRSSNSDLIVTATARSRSVPSHMVSSMGADVSSPLDGHEKNDFNSKESTPMESESSYFAGSMTPSSADGNCVSIDKLKHKMECDHRIMNSLYKELEEERSASAIATNQAMAMITRLQEEKATLRLESLQYLRMMEEQAEYDARALQKANDLLAEKDKVIQDLEAELEFLKNQHETLLLAENSTRDDKIDHV